MIKKIALGVIFLFVFVALAHPVLWLFNRKIFSALVPVQKELQSRPPERLMNYRHRLEESAIKELNSYKWLDQRKEYVQIPVERAFDYYLRRPKP